MEDAAANAVSTDIIKRRHALAELYYTFTATAEIHCSHVCGGQRRWTGRIVL